MTAATVMFVIIGGVGVLLLALSLLGVDLFDLNGFASLEAVAVLLGAFGFSAAVASSLLDADTGLAVLASAGVGVGAAVPAGWFAMRLARAASEMRTDATPMREDLIGLMGVVVTPVPAQGYGEVRVSLGGQPVKLNASADTAIPFGAHVFVVTAPSDTSVVVERIPAPPDSLPQNQ